MYVGMYNDYWKRVKGPVQQYKEVYFDLFCFITFFTEIFFPIIAGHDQEHIKEPLSFTISLFEEHDSIDEVW